jgi:nitrous oxidase accessory protein NosD
MNPILLMLAVVVADPTLRVDRDNVAINKTCRVELPSDAIPDADNNGVIRITGDDIVVDFANEHLRGARPDQPPESYAGYGVRVLGKRVTIRNLRVSGFKTGIYATQADGLVIEDCDVSDNFRQRLRSTPAAEDLADWLYPHHNDENQWLGNYGAGIYIEEAKNVTVRRCRARNGQNGLCMRRVDDSRVYDNDFSFLSGWGIALYRSNRNVISRNSCDFCIRGYSHGVYSRGQDSAGILFFEQCNENIVAANSATHGGDGFFGYAGNEVLDGKSADPRAGCNNNLIIGNDFSYSAANAIEMTFSRDNRFVDNRLIGGNYGIWGGYSSHSLARRNAIEDNLIAGIAVEHGADWSIEENALARNPVGVKLWWDDDADLLAKPWAKANNTASKGHRIVRNHFTDSPVGVELTGGTTGVRVFGNRWTNVQSEVSADKSAFTTSQPTSESDDENDNDQPMWPTNTASQWPGQRQAVGARKQLGGREAILMTEYGPYEHERPYVRFVEASDGSHRYQILGAAAPEWWIDCPESALNYWEGKDNGLPTFFVEPARWGQITCYAISADIGGETFYRGGAIVAAPWEVRVFAYQTDPREDIESWRRAGLATKPFYLDHLKLPYRGSGPSDLACMPESIRSAKLPRDRFGMIATTSLLMPPRDWELRTTSDDGVRVWVDDKLLIDNWTHHGPTIDTARLDLKKLHEAHIRVEHFELDGHAVLDFGMRFIRP